MIFGRPVNLVLGAFTALLNVAVLVAKQADPEGLGAFFTPEIILALNAAAGAIVAVIANQTPTITTGGSVNVQTPAGQPNGTATLNVTPAGEVTVA